MSDQPREPLLPMALPAATGPLRERAASQRCKFCRKTLVDEREKAWNACQPCLDSAEIF